MESSKQIVQDVLDRLPDGCTLEDVQYHLYVAETIRHRRELARCELPISNEEAKARLKKWLIE